MKPCSNKKCPYHYVNIDDKPDCCLHSEIHKKDNFCDEICDSDDLEDEDGNPLEILCPTCKPLGEFFDKGDFLCK